MANELTTKNQFMQDVSEKLTTLLTQQASALPKEFNQTRFLQNCLTVLNDTKDIDKCSPVSVARTMIKGAYLGLDFFRRECYAIPYGGELQFQTDYKGEIKLAKKYSLNKIRDIYAKLVREGDDFTAYVQEGVQYINFRPKPFNDNAIVGAFAVAYFDDESMIYDAMSTKEIEHTRKNFSKMAGGKAWTLSIGEMYKKTVLRRLCKMIELDFETSEQDQAFDEGNAIDVTAETNGAGKSVPDPFKAAQTIGKPKDTPQGKIEQGQAADPSNNGFPAVDQDAELRKTLTEKHTDLEPWQITAMIKESKEVAK